jgi:hypothetical protein
MEMSEMLLWAVHWEWAKVALVLTILQFVNHKIARSKKTLVALIQADRFI